MTKAQELEIHQKVRYMLYQTQGHRPPIGWRAVALRLECLVERIKLWLNSY